MFSRVYFGLVSSVVVFVATNAQDLEECKKIQKALECCRPPNEMPKGSFISTFVGDPKEIIPKAKGCIDNLKDLKATKPGEPSDYLPCLAECLLNGTMIMTPDLKFNQEVGLKIFENDPEYKEFATKQMQICEEKTAKIPESAKCKTNFVAFTTCMVDQFANNCPKAGPKASAPECEAKNLSLEKCNIASFIP